MSEAEPWSRRALEHGDFWGFVPIGALLGSDVPAEPGVSVVLRPSDAPPVFRLENPAGRYRRKDPTVAPELLRARWVEGAEVLYIGTANDLRGRLDTLRRFGAGEPVAHWGGRQIWQLEDADRLLVAWNTTREDPEVVGARMLRDFRAHYGRLPFGNIRS